MKSNTNFPRQGQSVPWSLSLAFGVFLLYLVVIPCFVRGVVFFFEDRFPVFEETTDGEIINQAPALKDQNGENAQVADDEQGVGDAGTTGQDEQSSLTPDQVAKQHPLARLLIRSRTTPYFQLVAGLFFMAVVCFAPLAEEFVFRVVLQGTVQNILEVDAPLPNPDSRTTALPSAEISDDEARQFRQRSESDRRTRRVKALLAILLPALLFAALHSGVPDDPNSPTPLSELFHSLVGTTFSNLLTFVIGLTVLLCLAGARLSDLGLPDKFTVKEISAFLKSWGFGILLMLLGSPIIFGVNRLAENLFPEAIVAPIPIFILALYLGFVYYRYKRFATILGMHMTLNFISFVTLMSLVNAQG